MSFQRVSPTLSPRVTPTYPTITTPATLTVPAPRAIAIQMPGDPYLPSTLSNLPYEVFVQLLINTPVSQIASLCQTNVQMARICQDEYFLRDLTIRKYRFNLGRIPGNTFTEKWQFLSQFDPRYFTDPEFIKIPPSFKRYIDLDYLSRKDPNDALDTIISILNDAQTKDIYTMETFPGRSGGETINRNLSAILAGAILTKSQPFAQAIASIILPRIHPDYKDSYKNSLRFPFELSLLYGMTEVTNLISQYYDYKSDRLFRRDLFELIRASIRGSMRGIADPIKEVERFVPYVDAKELYWYLVRLNQYELADRLKNKSGEDFHSSHTEAMNTLRSAIYARNLERIRYVMQYYTPHEELIDSVMRSPATAWAVPILQGEAVIEPDADIDPELELNPDLQ